MVFNVLTAKFWNLYFSVYLQVGFFHLGNGNAENY